MTVTHQSCCRIEHRLQTIHQTRRDAVEFDAAVVQRSRNHRLDERHQNGDIRDGATDAANVTQQMKLGAHGPRHMGLRGHVTIDVYPRSRTYFPGLVSLAQTRSRALRMMCCW